MTSYKWSMLGMLLLISATPLVLGKIGLGASAGFVFATLAMIAGLALLLLSPPQFVAFTLWLWILTPLIRRVYDHNFGYTELNSFGLAPTLVSLLGILRIRLIGQLGSTALIFFPILAALFYGYLVGIVRAGIAPATYAFIQWAAPVFLAILIVMERSNIDAMKQEISTTLKWAMILMGVYGVIQFLFLPSWDATWMRNVQMTSIGQPVPLKVRVFSTMNSPMVAASVAVVGVLISMNSRTIFGWLAASFGTTVIALSLVRSAWGALVVGIVLLVLLAFRDNPLRSIRVAIGTILVGILVLAGVLLSPLGERLLERAGTFSTIDQDVSYEARIRFYESMATEAFTQVVGQGLGATGISRALSENAPTGSLAFDSGLMEIPLVLGIGGALFYLVPIVYGLAKGMISYKTKTDLFLQAAAATVFVYILQLVFANRFIGAAGVFCFAMFGVLLSESLDARNGQTPKPALGSLRKYPGLLQ